MGIHSALKRSFAPLVLGLCATLLLPTQALAQALIRFVHAVPGVGTATVEVNDGSGNVDLGSIGFAQATPWRSIRAGSFRWALEGAGKTLASGTAIVGDGAYDIVVLDKTTGVALGIYKARGGTPGKSLVRVIHAAPELGSPELMLDSKLAVKSLGFTQATPYLSVSSGAHALDAMRPGDSAPLVSAHVSLTPGVAYSAIVLGSRGAQVRVLSVVDRAGPPARSTSTTTTPAPARSKVIVVKSGDSLWSLAASQLRAGATNEQIERKLVQIWDRNAARIGTGNPNLIFPGQRLIVD